MDPNQALANLQNMINLARKRMHDDTDNASFCVVENAIVTQIIESFGDLDGWLKRGGSLPGEWQANR